MMNKLYVDMEELEDLFKRYAIPYTNIFDELASVSAQDIADDMSVYDLKRTLEHKEDIIAIQMWQKQDIKAALDRLGMKYDDELVNQIANRATGLLENCTDNWEKLQKVIKEVMERK